MTNFENLSQYVDNHIDSMNHSVDWAREKMQNDSRSFRLNWVCDAIEIDEAKMQGAVAFAQIYGKLITKDEAESLRERIHKAWCDARDRAFNEIV